MAYSQPPTLLAKLRLTATWLNTYLRDNFIDHESRIASIESRKEVGVHAYTAASQTISATTFGSGNTVTFTEVVDLGGDYSGNVFTAPHAGFYGVNFSFRWQSAVAAAAGMLPYLACSTLGDVVFPAGGSSQHDFGAFRYETYDSTINTHDPVENSTTRIVYLAAGETMSVEAIRSFENGNLTNKRLTIAALSALV